MSIRYHKSPFDKFVLNNKLSVSLPSKFDIKDINQLEDVYSLVSEESYQPEQLNDELEEKVVIKQPALTIKKIY